MKGAAQIRFASAREWSAVARSCPQYNFQQSPAYSLEIAKRRRASCEFVCVTDAEDPERIIGVASVRVRSAPVPGAGLAYIGAGPLLVHGLTAPGGRSALQALIEAILDEYVHRRRLCLRVTLPMADHAVHQRAAEVFEQCGFRSSSVGTYRTIVVDLAPSVMELRAAMAGNWRNHLKVASRGALTVESTRDADALRRFAPLLEETSRRKGFTTELDAAFYDQVQRMTDVEDRMLVAFAIENGKDVAGVVASLLGDTAIYLLGATTLSGRKAGAAYALQWQVIQIAKETGCRWYDLGGIDPDTNPGVHSFKAGLGGSDTVFPGPLEIWPPGITGLVGRVVSASYTHLKRWRS